MGEQVCTEQSANNSDICFEDRDVDVCVEVGPAPGQQLVHAIKLGVVAHDCQGVESWKLTHQHFLKNRTTIIYNNLGSNSLSSATMLLQFF